jgi:hypothetical protein
LVAGAVLPGVKWLVAAVDHLPPSHAKVKNEWSLRPYAFIA